jgi:hypothetical protein
MNINTNKHIESSIKNEIRHIPIGFTKPYSNSIIGCSWMSSLASCMNPDPWHRIFDVIKHCEIYKCRWTRTASNSPWSNFRRSKDIQRSKCQSTSRIMSGMPQIHVQDFCDGSAKSRTETTSRKMKWPRKILLMWNQSPHSGTSETQLFHWIPIDSTNENRNSEIRLNHEFQYD